MLQLLKVCEIYQTKYILENNLNILYFVSKDPLPDAVAALSEASNVSDHSKSKVVGSNPTRGMHVSVCILCVCIVLRGADPSPEES
jgi:hypothetical protein